MIIFRSLAICLLVCLNAALVADEPDPPTISVSGTAEVRVVPDNAVLRFSIDSRAVELAAAVADNDAKVKAVVRFLTESKIDDKFIRTELIRIRPIFEQPSKSPYPRQQTAQGAASSQPRSVEEKIKPIGYSARREISVTINDLSSFETIYRGLIERGVNEVDNLAFQSSELRKHRDEARLLAVRAAREKAEAMARELGCTLAAVQTIRESNPGWRGSNMMQNRVSLAGGEAGSSVASGMMTISATVDVVFVLGNVRIGE